jgi:hypothetical protein
MMHSETETAPLKYRGGKGCNEDLMKSVYDHIFLRSDPRSGGPAYRLNTMERVCTELSDHPFVFVRFG